MMKKLTALIMALLMCLSVASAWSCPTCGGNMEGNLFTDYSTLALRILSNNGYLYRGSPMSSNMNMKIPFGS